MKHLLIALSLAAAAGSTLARTPHAAASASDSNGAVTATTAATSTTASTATEPGTPQRSKMKLCNADAKAKGVHGPDRRAFMKQCLSGKAKPAAAS